jgi:hypothetical protein
LTLIFSGISRYTGGVKIVVALEEPLVRRLDSAARAVGLTRSAYVSQLLKREFGQAQGPGAGPSAKAAIWRLDRLFAAMRHEAAAAAVRAERDAR